MQFYYAQLNTAELKCLVKIYYSFMKNLHEGFIKNLPDRGWGIDVHYVPSGFATDNVSNGSSLTIFRLMVNIVIRTLAILL